MNAPSPSDLLGVWERASVASAAERPLLLLEVACRERPAAELAQLGVAQRDALLLDLREALFGPQLRSLVRCLRCHEQVEFVVRTDSVRPVPRSKPAGPFTFETAGFRGVFRLPVSGDWLVLPTENADPKVLRESLTRRCLVHLERADGAAADGDPPVEVLEVVAQAIAEHDSDAHLEFEMTCPTCGHEWDVLFDIGAYLWREVDARCRRWLLEVHQLASAYGWSESEILQLSPARRQRYLELVHGHE